MYKRIAESEYDEEGAASPDDYEDRMAQRWYQIAMVCEYNAEK